MDPSYPLLPSSGAGSPVPRRGGGVARPPAGAPGPAPVHAAGEMGLSTGEPLRDACWDMIGPRTRERLQDHAGALIDWYATGDPSSGDGRPYAVLFGDRGLSIAEPRLNTEHRPVYAVSAFLFEPGSLRHVPIDHRPPPVMARGPASTAAPSSGPGASGRADIGLTAPARGVLGNLPPRAQELLQTPFLPGAKVLRCDWYYQGHAHRLSMFMLYLAGTRDVTVATGTKIVPAGHDDATAHWSLTCYRAAVARRIGR
ncbi:hypothetical protein [Actinomadura parmotrematis]|uniref:hypothetical protein n=1 Tax=Actinomadura parmotrematis TaxID=2864039 RepID=UPI00215DC227|nr:hypothetical protein [Actinomadura parmotrematis]